MGTNDSRALMSPNAVPMGQPRRRPSGAIVRRTSDALDLVQGESLVARAREQARAFLANDAIENVTALSAFEAQCIEMAPLAEPRLKALVDGYALAAAQAIVQFGR